MTLTLTHFLILGAVLFAIGVFGAITRRNAIGILMSLELIFNAVNINLVAVSRYVTPVEIQGQIFTIFIIASLIHSLSYLTFISVFKGIYSNFT